MISQCAVENIKKAKNKLKAKIMGGILPIVSYRNDVFMNEEVAGIFVDENIVNMYEDLSREEALKFEVSISMYYIEKYTTMLMDSI